MSSAFRTFTSAAGVGSACYLLAMATWDQVLLLFLAASLGWCVFAMWIGNRKSTGGSISATNQRIIRTDIALKNEQVAPKLEEPAPPRKVYKFPIHELAGSTAPRSFPAFD
jgi:hypothetical protein